MSSRSFPCIENARQPKSRNIENFTLSLPNDLRGRNLSGSTRILTRYSLQDCLLALIPIAQTGSQRIGLVNCLLYGQRAIVSNVGPRPSSQARVRDHELSVEYAERPLLAVSKDFRFSSSGTHRVAQSLQCRNFPLIPYATTVHTRSRSPLVCRWMGRVLLGRLVCHGAGLRIASSTRGSACVGPKKVLRTLGLRIA